MESNFEATLTTDYCPSLVRRADIGIMFDVEGWSLGRVQNMFFLVERISELRQWLATLEPGFAFLLALPFVVGLMGLAAEWVRRRAQQC